MKNKKIIKGYQIIRKRFYNEETCLEDDILDYFNMIDDEFYGF